MTSAPPPVPTADPERAPARSGWAVRFLALFHRIAEAGWSTTAVGTWAVAQSAVVPGPMDAVLIPLALADPPRAWRFATVATLGTTAGSLLAYAVGLFAFDSVGMPLLSWLGVTGAELELYRHRFREQGWWLVLLSTLTPMPGKLVAIGAGAFGIPLLHYVGAIVAGRAFRFYAIAAVCRFAGDRVELWIERKYGKTLHELALRERPAAAAAAPRPDAEQSDA